MVPLLAADQVLSASGGCYEWVTRRPDVVTVAPLFEETVVPGAPCPRGTTRKALVTVSWRGGSSSSGSGGGGAMTGGGRRERVATVVVAREVTTQEEMQCDVFVAQVSATVGSGELLRDHSRHNQPPKQAWLAFGTPCSATDDCSPLTSGLAHCCNSSIDNPLLQFFLRVSGRAHDHYHYQPHHLPR